MIIAIAFLPAVFIPVPAFGDFFYLPKVLVLLAVEIVTARRLLVAARRQVRAAAQGSATNPLLLPVLTYWTVLLLSTITSVNPITSITGGVFRWEGFIVFLLYGGLTLMVPAALRMTQDDIPGPEAPVVTVEAKLDRLLRWGLGVAVVLVAYALIQRYGLDPAPRDPLRTRDSWWFTAAFSTLGNSNFFGSYMALYTALAAARFLAGREGQVGRPVDWFWLVGAGVVYYGLLTSLSRGAWLAAGAAVALTLLVMLLAGLRPTGQRVMALAAVFLMLTFTWRSADPMAAGRVDAFVTDTAQQTGTVGQRLWMWRGTWAAVTARPVLGWGLDTLRYVFPRFEPPGRAEAGLTGGFVDRAHNDYLQVAVSSGLLGLAAYLWILWRGARSAWRVIADREASPLSRQLAASLAAGALAHLAAMFMNISTISESPAFWGFLGAIAALSMFVGSKGGRGAVER